MCCLSENQVGEIPFELGVMKEKLATFQRGTKASSWPITELLSNMKFTYANSKARVEYTVTKENGESHVWKLDAGKHRTRTKWLESIEKIVHGYVAIIEQSVPSAHCYSLSRRWCSYVDCIYEQMEEYFPEDVLEWTNLWSIFSPRSIPATGSKSEAWSDLDTQLTQLGELYGETGLTRKLTPSEMVGQDVEVFWPLEKKWYPAVITCENDNGSFQVKYADQGENVVCSRKKRTEFAQALTLWSICSEYDRGAARSSAQASPGAVHRSLRLRRRAEVPGRPCGSDPDRGGRTVL